MVYHGLVLATLLPEITSSGVNIHSSDVSTILLNLLMAFNPSHLFSCLHLSAQQLVARLSLFPHRDFTDNDLDGVEVENTSRSRSSPPIPSAAGCLDAHFGQDQIAIESTGNSFLSLCHGVLVSAEDSCLSLH